MGGREGAEAPAHSCGAVLVDSRLNVVFRFGRWPRVWRLASILGFNYSGLDFGLGILVGISSCLGICWLVLVADISYVSLILKAGNMWDPGPYQRGCNAFLKV